MSKQFERVLQDQHNTVMATRNTGGQAYHSTLQQTANDI